MDSPPCQICPPLHSMKVDVAPDPITVAALGVDGIMLEPHHLADLVEKFQFGIGNDPLRGSR